MRKQLSNLIHVHQIDWEGWDFLIQSNGITIDRPINSAHPSYPEIMYPIDYGFVNGTTSSDGEEVDVFVGSSEVGLVATIATTDHRKGDSELKLIYNCTPAEVYLVNGFINFDRRLMEGTLVLRKPLCDLISRP